MLFNLALTLGLAGIAQATVQGFDISNYQPNVNFASAYSSGARFVIIKATEGTSYTDPSFSNHYTGATKAGFIRGGYHFAHPDESSGATQAKFFLAHGGGWSKDGITLPGMLDIEYNPNGATCYGLSASAMVSWIADFVNTYHAATSRYPLIYSTANWWETCTGNSAAFSQESPLVLARYGSSPGSKWKSPDHHPACYSGNWANNFAAIPGNWGYQTIWQNADSYSAGGDSDIFNGDISRLKVLATG